MDFFHSPPANFTLEEALKVEAEECTPIVMLWQRLCDDAYNSPNFNTHMPPGLMGGLNAVIQTLPILPWLEQFTPLDLHEAIRENMAYTASVMFILGQYAHANGLLHQNMEPCRCSKVTDEELRSFIEGGE